MNTPRITLITLAIFVSAATYAMQFELVPNQGGVPVMVEGEIAIATSKMLKSFLDDIPSDKDQNTVKVETKFSHATLNTLVAAMESAHTNRKHEKVHKKVYQAITAATTDEQSASNQLDLLPVADFFGANSVVFDACARHVAKQIISARDRQRKDLKTAMEACEACKQHGNQFTPSTQYDFDAIERRKKRYEVIKRKPVYENENVEWWEEVVRSRSFRAQKRTLKWLYLLDPTAYVQKHAWGGELILCRAGIKLYEFDSKIGNWSKLLRCSAQEIARYKKKPVALREFQGVDVWRYNCDHDNYPWLRLTYAPVTYAPVTYAPNHPISSLAGFHTIAEIPDDLDSLVITNNLLRKIPLGVFSKYTMLKELDFSNNSLTSACVPAILMVTTLQKLILNNNQITELPDDFFTQLPELRTFCISDNGLTAFPSSLGKTKELYKLHCKFNFLPREQITPIQQWAKAAEKEIISRGGPTEIECLSQQPPKTS